MPEGNSHDYKIKDLLDRLAADKDWQPDDKLRAKAAGLMKMYSTMV